MSHRLIQVLITACLISVWYSLSYAQPEEIKGRFVAWLDGQPLGEVGSVTVVDRAAGVASPVVVQAPIVYPGAGEASWQDSTFQCVLFGGVSQQGDPFDVCIEFTGEPKEAPTAHVVAHVMKQSVFPPVFLTQKNDGLLWAYVTDIHVLSEYLALYSVLFEVELASSDPDDATVHFLSGVIQDFPVTGTFDYVASVDPGCGLDITDGLRTTLTALEIRFQQLTSRQREELCDCLTNPLYAIHAWDILELSAAGSGSKILQYTPPQVDADCAHLSSACAGKSVAVDGKYFYPNSVNYVVYGVMKRACFEHEWASEHGLEWMQAHPDPTPEERAAYRAEYAEELRWSRDMMNLTIDAYKGPGASLEGIRHLLKGRLPRPAPNWRFSREWANAGFDLWHRGRTDSPQEEVACDQKTRPSTITILTVQWCEDYDFLKPLGW